MEAMCASFQDKIVLKMQSNMHTSSDKRASDRKRWRNDLLRKAYGNRLQRKKPISKKEAQLLPFFAHAAGEPDSIVAGHW